METLPAAFAPQARHRSYDAWGNVLTTRSRDATLALDRAIRALLSHRVDVSRELELALSHDPQLALAHVMRGFGLRLLARNDALTEAELALAQGEFALLEREHSERERLLTAALRAFCAHDAERAMALLERALEVAPSCLLTMKLHHAVCFMHGEVARMRSALARALARMDSSLPGYHFALGCYAFALEESGNHAEAERLARHALAYDPHDVWSYHALLHVYTMRDRTREGLALVRERKGLFPGVNNFGAHVAWHHALFALGEGRCDEALTLYDEEIATSLARDYRDLANCASLLFRLECAGSDVGARWERLADYAEARRDDALLAFADLHQLLALARSGRAHALRERLQTMRAAALSRRGLAAQATRTVGLPLGEGILALSQGAHVTAMARLAKSNEQLQTLGGSRAQRELFELLAVEASARAGDLEIGGKLVREKLRERPRCRWARSYGTGFAKRATSERREAEEDWARRTGQPSKGAP